MTVTLTLANEHIHLRKAISDLLTKYFDEPVTITHIRAVGGGSINHAAKIDTDHGTFFVKWNLADKYPQMFEKEAKGLALLESAGVLRVPKVIGASRTGMNAFLILEYIEVNTPNFNFWEYFGRDLAKLHQTTYPQFGLDYPNFVGSLVQSNDWHDDFTSFFIHQRLKPQLKLAVDNQYLGKRHVQQFNRLFKKLPALIPSEVPALVHGDLWSGNFMVDGKGKAALVDPAVYYGHREVDLAMSHLFGGFDYAFYEAYNEVFPLASGFKDRIEIYNLYPLLVHINLFGNTYVSSVENVLSQF